MEIRGLSVGAGYGARVPDLMTPSAEAARVVDAVLHDLATGDHRGVVVDSPPGAGKITLVVGRPACSPRPARR